MHKNSSAQGGLNASPVAQQTEKFIETGGVTFDEQH